MKLLKFRHLFLFFLFTFFLGSYSYSKTSYDCDLLAGNDAKVSTLYFSSVVDFSKSKKIDGARDVKFALYEKDKPFVSSDVFYLSDPTSLEFHEGFASFSHDIDVYCNDVVLTPEEDQKKLRLHEMEDASKLTLFVF